MFSFDVTIDITAPPARVWRALCDPAEVVQWDTGVVEALDAPADYPQPGQHVRWRYSEGPFRLLHDRPQEVVPERTLRSLIAIGPARFDETYTLEPRDRGCRLTAAMIVRAPLWLGGPIAERFYVGPTSCKTVTASLAAIKRYCEGGATL
ncbi:MAG: SRPBCC domain-containing protein [Dehalococcoidia bacterium]